MNRDEARRLLQKYLLARDKTQWAIAEYATNPSRASSLAAGAAVKTAHKLRLEVLAAMTRANAVDAADKVEV